MRHSILLLATAAIALAACSTTRTIGEWRDPAYTGGPFQSVLVIGVSDRDAARRQFEDRFVSALEAAGTEAVASHRLLGTDTKIDEASVRDAIAGRDIGGVIVTHLIGVDEETVYHPPTWQPGWPYYYGGFYGYYSRVYNYVYEPGYYTRHTLVRLETNLYDAAKENLVWSMQSETVDPESVASIIGSQIDLAVEQLAQAGLIGGGG